MWNQIQLLVPQHSSKQVNRNSSFSNLDSSQSFESSTKKQYSSKNILKNLASPETKPLNKAKGTFGQSGPRPSAVLRSETNHLKHRERQFNGHLSHQVQDNRVQPQFLKKSEHGRKTQFSKQFGETSFMITIHETSNQEELPTKLNQFQPKMFKSNISCQSTGNHSNSSSFDQKIEKVEKTKLSERKRSKSYQNSEMPDFFPQHQSEDKITLHDFEQIRKLGQGAYGQVFLVRHIKTHLIFALKILKKQHIRKRKVEENVLREIKIHYQLSSQNVVKMYSMFSDDCNVYLILQYMPDGSLWEKWKKQKSFDEKKTAKIILNIATAVHYLHELQIFHRDIKLQNILMAKGVAKLGDFGCAVQSICMRKTRLGSPNYLSPEQLHQRFYNKKVDIWSLGVVTYELLFGFSPFEEEIIHALKNNLSSLAYELLFPAQVSISNDAKDFIQKTLQKNPNARLDIQGVLNHPFLKKAKALSFLPYPDEHHNDIEHYCEK